MTNATPAPAAVQPSDRVSALDVGYWAWYGGWWAKHAQGGPTMGVDASKACRHAQPPTRRKTAHVGMVGH